MARLVVVALAVALLGVAPALADQIQVDITECDPSGTREERAACEKHSETVAPQTYEESHTIHAPVPSAAPQHRTEVHDYSLRSGRGRTNVGGETEEVQLESLDLKSKVEPREQDDGDHEDDDHNHGAVEFDPDDDVLPEVTTNGGSPFAGFGSGFQFMTSDEALAQFAIPPFLVPIYVSAGRAYGVPWNILAAINKIETDFGRIKHQVSYAGARGWMQFMPGTWARYGVDATRDGVADPWNPVDAIYAAARYLAASGAPTAMRRAIWAYNHADWYVDQVLEVASTYGALPGGLVAETGSLAFGRFPVLGPVSYGDDFRRAEAAGRRPRGLEIEARSRAAVIATQNVTVKKILLDRHLARAFRRHGQVRSRGLAPAPKPGSLERRDASNPVAGFVDAAVEALVGDSVTLVRERVASRSRRRTARADDRLPVGYARSRWPGIGVVVQDALGNRYRYSGLRRLRPKVRPGARLRGAQRIGRLERRKRPTMLFAVRAGGGAPVDPRPLVDGYRLQEAADFYNALGPSGGNPFLPDLQTQAPGGVIQGNQAQLASRVLRDSGINIYPCGRQDIARGIVDKRVLGAMLYLRSAGLELTVTSLRCGHGYYTASGNVSAHSYGAAMDIAAFNGQSVLGNQGPGSLTEQAVKLLMKLEGSAQPSQLISLMNLGGPSFAMADHADHLHVGYGFQQAVGVGRTGNALGAVTFDGKGSDILSGGQVTKEEERKLSRKLASIPNPEVRQDRGQGALKVEAEHRDEKKAADRLARKQRPPFHVSATAAGARLIDVDIPVRRRGDEAYAVGVVAGTTHKGWDRDQTVVLAHRDSTWRIVGAPVDARGDTKNPRLRALATVRGGAGYAVGDDGSVVRLDGLAPPRLIRTRTKQDLLAVDAAGRKRRPLAVAVGRRGSALRLAGSAVDVERVGSRRASLTAVALDSAGGAVATSASKHGVDPALLYRRTRAGWSPIEVELDLPPGAGVRLGAVATGGGQLWLGGAITDAKTAGAPAELPLAVQLGAGGTSTTYCAGTPALAAVRELGPPTAGCDRDLVSPMQARGPIADVAVTRAGPLISTAGSLYLLRKGRFQALPADPGALLSDDGVPASVSLAVSASGTGWGTARSGHMVRIDRAGGKACAGCEAKMLPFSEGGAGALAIAPDGAQALVLAGGKTAVWNSGDWEATAGVDTAVRDLAWSSRNRAWAVAETGALLTYHDREWSAPEESGVQRSARELLTDTLTSRSLIGHEPTTTAAVEALSFRSSDEGYAVGAGGILRFDGDDWARETTPGDARLTDVVAGAQTPVAVGSGGTLLERTGDGWERHPGAEQLSGGKDFTVVDALPDGSVLAVAGGAPILKRPDGDWEAAPLAPLGVPVAELHAYRGKAGLVALALVGGGEEKVLLQGTAVGWKPLSLPSGVRPVDIDLLDAEGQLWLSAHSPISPLVIRMAFDKVEPDRAQLDEVMGSQVERLGEQLDRMLDVAASVLAGGRKG